MREPAKARILIADDEPNLRLTLADILTEEGYEVATVANGKMAVEMCSQRAYDVILMDVKMPLMDGVTAFQEIRRQHEDARVIFMSAYVTDELRMKTLEEGALAFLSKPLRIDSVLKLIDEAKDTAILVVEAKAGEAAQISRFIRESGYWVRTAESAQQALALAAQIRFGVIFIDVHLPTTNGLELYLALQEITPASVAIIMSSRESGAMELAREAVQLTAYGIVHKPLDPEDVLALLKRLAGQRISGKLYKPPSDVS